MCSALRWTKIVRRGALLYCCLALWPVIACAADRSESNLEIQGLVVDKSGVPVANVDVMLLGPGKPQNQFDAHTDSGGKFVLHLPAPRPSYLLAAKEDSRGRFGFLQFVPKNPSPQSLMRITLREVRVIPISVVDAKGRPVADAKIGPVFRFDGHRQSAGEVSAAQQLSVQQTDVAGKAELRVPTDLSLGSIFAVKGAAGFDYVLYRDPREPTASAKPAPDDSRPLRFVLGGVHRFRVHLVDEHRRPLPNVRVVASHIQRPGRQGPALLGGIAAFGVKTDVAGIAEFDAIPADVSPLLIFSSATPGYTFREQPNFDPAEPTTELTVVATRLPVLRVQVTYADGRPALGATIRCVAKNLGSDGSATVTATANSEGDNKIYTFREDGYCVVSARQGRFASTMQARVGRLREPLRAVRLVLNPAILVHGTLTDLKTGRVVANEPVTLLQHDVGNYSKLPAYERLPGVPPITLAIPVTTKTDAQGRFEFFAATGHYTIGAGNIPLHRLASAVNVKTLYKSEATEIDIGNQTDLEINLSR